MICFQRKWYRKIEIKWWNWTVTGNRNSWIFYSIVLHYQTLRGKSVGLWKFPSVIEFPSLCWIITFGSIPFSVHNIVPILLQTPPPFTLCSLQFPQTLKFLCDSLIFHPSWEMSRYEKKNESKNDNKKCIQKVKCGYMHFRYACIWHVALLTRSTNTNSSASFNVYFFVIDMIVFHFFLYVCSNRAHQQYFEKKRHKNK